MSVETLYAEISVMGYAGGKTILLVSRDHIARQENASAIFLACPEYTLSFFDGTTEEILYDNAKAVALKHDGVFCAAESV